MGKTRVKWSITLPRYLFDELQNTTALLKKATEGEGGAVPEPLAGQSVRPATVARAALSLGLRELRDMAEGRRRR